MKVLSILSTLCEICGVDEVAMEKAFPSVSSIYLSQPLLHQWFIISDPCGMQQSLPGSTLSHPWYSSGGSHL